MTVCMSLRAHGDARHVHAAVAHGHQARSFLPAGLPRGGEFGHRAARRGFGRLPAGVGVDFGIEHQHVDVPAGGQHVIEAAVADVVGPAVAAQDPDALLDQRIGQRSAGRALPACRRRPASACSSRHALALGEDAGFGVLIGVEDGLRQILADDRRSAAPPARARIRSACRRPGACPGRIRRCLRTASSTRPGRGPSSLTQ